MVEYTRSASLDTLSSCSRRVLEAKECCRVAHNRFLIPVRVHSVWVSRGAIPIVMPILPFSAVNMRLTLSVGRSWPRRSRDV